MTRMTRKFRQFSPRSILAGLAVVASLAAGSANAAVITTLYGDIDGFGAGYVGALPSNPLSVNNAGVGEAPLTDVGLIDVGFLDPPFNPTGSFAPFVVGGPIVSASVTVAFGAFDPITPLCPQICSC